MYTHTVQHAKFSHTPDDANGVCGRRRVDAALTLTRK
jgi:hypothetical protein